MSDVIALCEARRNGLLLTADLRDLGTTTQMIRELVADGSIVSVRRGVFVAGSRWAAMQPEDRHRQLVRSLRHTSDRDLVVCRRSAAVMHGLPLVGAAPERVHALAPDARGGSSNRFLASHRSEPVDSDAVIIDGIRVTSLARTVTDLAIHTPMLASVPSIDQALREVRLWNGRDGHWTASPTKEQLLDLLDMLAPRRGYARAAHSISFADADSMSVGEGVSRVQMHRLGFVPPVLQHRFILSAGIRADVDFWWPDVRAIGEFDGRLKYFDDRFRGGDSADAVVFREKLREDELRRQSARFVRWDWACAMDALRLGSLLAANGIPRR